MDRIAVLFRGFSVFGVVLVSAMLIASGSPSSQEARSRSPHGAIKMPCGDCHSTESWRPVRSVPNFSHSSTGFPIEGMHKGLGCRECHVTLAFSDTGARCSECHADIHRRQMGNNCEECHTAGGWQRIARSADEHDNRFPLFGAHAAVECEACHTNAAVGLFRGLSTDCFSCHANDFLISKELNHQALGFSTRCETCHSTASWFAGFNHGAFTGFPVTGAHARLTCTDCHRGGRFTGTLAECAVCHLEDYNSTANPVHSTAGFGRECAVCHNTVAWVPATFDHSKTRFPLSGSHASVACTSCHISGVYTGTPADCYSCHSNEYNSVTDPNHQAAAFPRDCSICHSALRWSGATFTHTAFPIYNGTHANRWSSCSECHPNSGDYRIFSCITCHGRAETDSEHGGVSNYVYNSTNCYSCHPGGESD